MADPIEVLTAKVDALAQGMAEGFARVERMEMTSGSATATFKADAEPTAVVIDPDVRLLAAVELARR